MGNYLVTDTELTQVANAIRAKARAPGALTFPVGFVNTISGIAEKAAATYNVSGSNQVIAAGQYLAGAQTIRGVTTANLSAANIKHGVTVKVGDAGDDDRIAGVAGTFTSDGTAAAGDMLSGKTAYVKGSKITGSIASKAAATYNVSGSNQTIAAGQYLSGAQTIRGVTTTNLTAENIRSGVTVKVGDAADDDRIAGVTGTLAIKRTIAGTLLSGSTRTIILDGTSHRIGLGTFSSNQVPYMAELLLDGSSTGVSEASHIPVTGEGGDWAGILSNYRPGTTITYNQVRVNYYQYSL